jgi:glycosyltransferase involved in cell wall biosynthesis
MKASVIIPVFNSADIQRELYKRLIEILDINYPDFEIIFINDGSHDNSGQILKEICQKDTRVRLIDFSKNFGHQAAISAGLQRTQGDIIVIMDDDLQDPPEVLPTFINKLNEGYDVVYGVRKKRKERLLKRFSYHLFYRLLGVLSHNQIQIDSGDFCVMRKNIVDAINRFPESNKFLRGIRSCVGFKQVGIEYERDSRYSGKPQYTPRKYFRFALNAIFSFSYLPLRITTLLGVVVASLSFFYGIFIILKKLLGFIEHVPGFTSLFVLTAFLGGTILISIGIIGEYFARLYDEVKKRPQYIIREEVNFDQ